jgi:peptidoglycan/xylan/chitin deacetylase (PgdA/CDA1 family)
VKGKNRKYVNATSGLLLAEQLRSTDFAGKAELFSLLSHVKENAPEEFWKQLSEQQVKELAASEYASIGCHGYYHNDLSKISLEKATEEMIMSKSYLEGLTGKSINSLAFPYGAYSKQLITEVKKLGFSKLLATDFLFEDDNAESLLKERLTINPYISSINQMHATISGQYK